MQNPLQIRETGDRDIIETTSLSAQIVDESSKSTTIGESRKSHPEYGF